MNICIRSNYAKDVTKVVVLEPEEMAGHAIGNRMTFLRKHDVIFQFQDGSTRLENIEMIINMFPNQFFCYRGEELELAGTVVMECLEVDVDLREPINGVCGTAFLQKKS